MAHNVAGNRPARFAHGRILAHRVRTSGAQPPILARTCTRHSENKSSFYMAAVYQAFRL